MRSGPATTTAAGELIFGYGTTTTAKVGTGFVTRSTFDSDLTEDRISGAPGPYEAVGTMTTGTGWTMLMLALRGR
jgi:hypothetical protein